MVCGMPPRGYANLSVREDVRRLLDELRAETGIHDLNDLLVVLVRTYRDYTNAISKIQELLTSIASKPGAGTGTVTSNTGNVTTTSDNVPLNVRGNIAPDTEANQPKPATTSTGNSPVQVATTKAKVEERRHVIVFSLEWAQQKGINIEEYMAKKERQGYLCNEANRKIYCVWREDIEQLVVDLNNAGAKMGELDKALSGERLETAKIAVEAGLLWYDNREKRWRAPL
jgi:hypothetical protein